MNLLIFSSQLFLRHRDLNRKIRGGARSRNEASKLLDSGACGKRRVDEQIGKREREREKHRERKNVGGDGGKKTARRVERRTERARKRGESWGLVWPRGRKRERGTSQRGYRWWRIVRQSRRPAAGVDVGDSSGSCGQSEGIVAMATGACVQTCSSQTWHSGALTHLRGRPSLYLNISAARVCAPMECANTCYEHAIRRDNLVYVSRVHAYRRIPLFHCVTSRVHVRIRPLVHPLCVHRRWRRLETELVAWRIGVNTIYLSLFMPIPPPPPRFFLFLHSHLFPPFFVPRVAKGVATCPIYIYIYMYITIPFRL